MLKKDLQTHSYLLPRLDGLAVTLTTASVWVKKIVGFFTPAKLPIIGPIVDLYHRKRQSVAKLCSLPSLLAAG